MELAPELRKFLDAGAALGLPEAWEATLEVIRANRYRFLQISGSARDIYSITNRFIPGPTGDLPIRIYRPSAEKNLPAMVYFHGGGWVLNFVDIYDSTLSAFAEEIGCVVIAVNYQKAPEHPFPTPMDDCYATLQWVEENANDLGIDSKRIGIGGDSAGANLSSGVALRARDENGPSIVYQLLIYPCNGLDFDTPSYQEFATGYGLSRQGMQWFWGKYLSTEKDKTNPYAVPMVSKNFKGLPPAIVITAGFDPLKDDGIKYDALLKAAGVPTIYKDYPTMIHGFFNLSTVTKTTAEAINDCSQFIRGLLKI